jgi:[ribosomal protein S5]-alanine N-acetyltransferase
MDEDSRLETERLRLRRYRQEDLEDLHAMFSDPEHMRWYPAPFDLETTRAWLDRQLAAYDTRGYALWIEEDRRPQRSSGPRVPRSRRSRRSTRSRSGGTRDPAAKGEGIAPEAASAARD